MISRARGVAGGTHPFPQTVSGGYGIIARASMIIPGFKQCASGSRASETGNAHGHPIEIVIDSAPTLV